MSIRTFDELLPSFKRHKIEKVTWKREGRLEYLIEHWIPNSGQYSDSYMGEYFTREWSWLDMLDDKARFERMNALQPDNTDALATEVHFAEALRDGAETRPL